jgi:prepilin-type N-terminal cleavage/methylation domain-containing protein
MEVFLRGGEKEMRKILNGQGGFTLIELLIVMLIIAILAIAVAPRFMNLTGGAQARTCQANQAAMDTATEVFRYQSDDGTLTPALTDLVGPGLLKGTAAPVCPAGGAYSFGTGTTDRWTCDSPGPPVHAR